MLYSMTGYGKIEQKNEQIKITTEIKTLNSKGLDINFKLPYYLRDIDLEIRNIIQEKLERGKIDVFLNIEFDEEALFQLYDINEFKKFYLQLKNLSENVINNISPYLEATFFREALNQISNQKNLEENLMNNENKQLIINSIRECCDLVNLFRKKEGEKLEQDILNQIQIISQLKSQIQSMEPNRKIKIKEKILSNLKENFDLSKINNDRLEQELIYYIEKIDINEELIRLNSHLNYFNEILMNGYGMGKKLGFIAQEIGREINTIGSKANDENIQKLVVEMKDALEKIKEQLNNIL